jgi:hypothetical protein
MIYLCFVFTLAAHLYYLHDNTFVKIRGWHGSRPGRVKTFMSIQCIYHHLIFEPGLIKYPVFNYESHI